MDDFRKSSKGGGVIFNPKTHIADFGNSKQGFLSMKLIQKSNFRVQGMFFNNCIEKNQNKTHFEEGSSSHTSLRDGSRYQNGSIFGKVPKRVGFRSAFFKVCLALIGLNAIVEKHNLNPEMTLLYQFHAEEALF